MANIDRGIIDYRREERQLTKVFKALSDGTRQEILRLLEGQQRTVGEIVERIQISQPGVSKHLRVLRDAGLVVARVDAQRRVYGVQPEPLGEIDAWLAPYRRM